MSIRRRLEVLDGQAPGPEPLGRNEACEWMRESLGLIARARRGELDPEKAAEVMAQAADIRRRMAEIRGRVLAECAATG